MSPVLLLAFQLCNEMKSSRNFEQLLPIIIMFYLLPIYTINFAFWVKIWSYWINPKMNLTFLGNSFETSFGIFKLTKINLELVSVTSKKSNLRWLLLKVAAVVRVQRVGRWRRRCWLKLVKFFITTSRHSQRNDSGNRPFLVHCFSKSLHGWGVMLAEQWNAVDVHL